MLKEVMTAEFNELFDKGVVLADFFSATCGPCKMLSFVLNDVEKTLGDKVTILKVNFEDLSEALPAFLTMAMMPFTGSIAEGIVFGGISYVLIKVLLGKRKDVSLVMYILAILFVIKLVLTSFMH